MDGLFDLVQSHRITAVLYAAAQLGVAEALRDGARSAGDLAPALQADADALRRLLVALTTIGVCTTRDGDRFAMTDLGASLDGARPDSVKDLVLFEGRMLATSWTGLVDSIRSGKTVAQLQGYDDSFTLMARKPEYVATFNAAMANVTRMVVPEIVAACDVSGARIVMDVGGGAGELLAGVLARHPHLRGIVLDLPQCADAATRRLHEAGVADRARFVPGDFFDDVPAGADTLLLKSIIHDWSDERCAVLLANCRRALPDGGRLLIVERVMPDQPEAVPLHRAHAMSDLNMLRGPGGRERTRGEHAGLLERNAFQLRAVTPAGFYAVLEALPV